ncbi:MAG: hypothetical protein MZV63_43230 [Marinilabiliales bacterium]|nr:hypothetical protein [Marinilabiliales bacterium]
MGDVFTDRVTSCRERLAKDGVEIADENCFTGFDAYQKVIDSGVDMILLPLLLISVLSILRLP